MISRSIHVAASDIISFVFMAEWYSIVYMYHIFFIHSSVNGRWGCFLVSAIVNSAAVNIGAHVFFRIRVFVFSGYMPWGGITGSLVVLFLVFWGTPILFSILAVPIYVSTNSVGRFPFLHTLSSISLSFYEAYTSANGWQPPLCQLTAQGFLQPGTELNSSQNNCFRVLNPGYA